MAVLAMAAYAELRQARGFSTFGAPTAMERWIAGAARGLAMPAAARRAANPIAESAAALADARAHWADHCAACHANNGSGDTEMGKHFDPPAPDMRAAETQHKSDGELFFIIQNGVRMSGMPAWGANGHEEDSWKLVHFIRHLPHMTAQEELDMQRMNPKSPGELEEEKQENDYLNGVAPNETKSHVH
ncbi:MAG TPA: c-type cytochrome [Bryobacteraceae bacterium]|nr:c-type cytochrome [Bryobacteraceae bacterium]